MKHILPQTHSLQPCNQTITFPKYLVQLDSLTQTLLRLHLYWIRSGETSMSLPLLAYFTFPLVIIFPFLSTFQSWANHQMTHKLTFRLHNTANRTNFTDKLSHTDWNTYLTADNIDSNCNIFLDKLYNMYYSSFPKITKTLTSKRLQKPWLTQSIINSIKHKFYLYKQCKLGIIPYHYYKEYRNYLNSLIKEVKSNFYQRKFTNFRNNTKKVWEIIKEIENSKGKLKISPQTVCHNSTEYSNPQEIANAFNTYFSQIAPKLSNKLPRAPRSHLTYLQGNFLHSMSIPLVTVTDIMNTITALKIQIVMLMIYLLKSLKKTKSYSAYHFQNFLMILSEMEFSPVNLK